MKNLKEYRVELTESNYPTDEGGKVMTYGIVLQQGDRQIQIDDISPNRQAVLYLIERLRRNPVDPDILPEIIDDYLTELYAI